MAVSAPVGTAACGCPKCSDPECQVERGHCHRRGCEERVQLEDGEPRTFCTRRCRGKASTNQPRAAMKRAEARRQRVAAELVRDPDATQAEIGNALGITQQTASRDLIWLEKHGKLEVKRRSPAEARAAGLAVANENKTARAVAKIGPVGRCGCPACGDPDCTVQPGRCHSPGCAEQAPVAQQTRVDRGWIGGKRTLCCGRHTTWIKRAVDAAHARGLLGFGEAADWLGVADITHYLSSGALEPDERGPGRLMWFSEATLKRCQSKLAREGACQLDTPAEAERWFDERHFDRLGEKYGSREARRRRGEVLARAERRRGQRARHHAGARRKDELRDELRSILQRVATQYPALGSWGYNEILAAVGEQAWAESLDDFRAAYPADRWGDFDPGYRRNVIERVARLVGDDVKALQTAAT